jgi:hypothetical protein
MRKRKRVAAGVRGTIFERLGTTKFDPEEKESRRHDL